MAKKERQSLVND